MTKSEQILQDMEGALRTISDEYATTIFRSLTVALSRAKHPSIVIEPISNIPVRQAIGRTSWTFTFQVSLLVRADVPDAAGDPAAELIFEKIMALQNNYDDLLPISINWEIQNGDKPLGAIVMQFNCLYQTAENSLSST